MNKRNRPNSGSIVLSRLSSAHSSSSSRRSYASPGAVSGHGGGGGGGGHSAQREVDLFTKELLELCTEIAGALLLGYTDGKPGRFVRRVITKGLAAKLRCPQLQAQSLVDLSLELIHFEAYGGFKRNFLELSLLVARCSGEVGDVREN